MLPVVQILTRVNTVRRSVLALSLALVLLSAAQARAYESFTTTVSLYQGVSLSEGMFVFDPRILTLIINPSDEVVEVLPEDSQTLFSFGDGIEFYFSYDPAAPAHITFMPEQLHGIAILEDSNFENIDDELLAGLDFTSDPPPTLMNPGDIVVLRLNDGSNVVLGDVRLNEDWRLSFDYLRPDSNAVPEPSTFMLFGCGAFGIWGLRIRKRKHRKGGNIMKRCNLLIFVFTILTLSAGTALAAEVTVTTEGSGEGTVIGAGIYCDPDTTYYESDCKETYPDETILHLEAFPGEKSEFSGWLIDGEPQDGTHVIRKDIVVAAIFNSISIPEFEIVETRPVEIPELIAERNSPLLDSRGEPVGYRQIKWIDSSQAESIVSFKNGANFKVYPLELVEASSDKSRIITYGRLLADLNMSNNFHVKIYSSSGEFIKSVEPIMTTVNPANILLKIEDDSDFWLAGIAPEKKAVVLRKFSLNGELIWERALPLKEPIHLALSSDGKYAAILLYDSRTNTNELQYYDEYGNLFSNKSSFRLYSGVEFISSHQVLLYSNSEWELYHLENLEVPVASQHFKGGPLAYRPIITFPQKNCFIIRSIDYEQSQEIYRIQARDNETGELIAESTFEKTPSQNFNVSWVTEQSSLDVLINEYEVLELRLPE